MHIFGVQRMRSVGALRSISPPPNAGRILYTCALAKMARRLWARHLFLMPWHLVSSRLGRLSEHTRDKSTFEYTLPCHYRVVMDTKGLQVALSSTTNKGKPVNA